MAVIVSGVGGTSVEAETNSKALRVVSYPVDDGALGTYSMGVQTGIMAAGLGAASEVFQFRWTSSNVCAIQTIMFSAGTLGTAFAAGGVVVDAVIARSFTVAGTGGGTATITGNNQKLRTSMATTVLGEARIATTAALTAGTKNVSCPFVAERSRATCSGVITGALLPKLLRT